MTIIKFAYLCLFFFIIFARIDAFNSIGNIIMSSIGFFNPLVRVIKSFYSIEKNSSSQIRYNCIKHLEYKHLQIASNKEIELNIKCPESRKKKKKLFFFHEEIIDSSRNITNNNKILNDTNQRQILTFIQNLTNETNTSEDSIYNVNNSNT